MSLILDAGAFLALERGNRTVVAFLEREVASGRVPCTHGGVIGQVWRGSGPRQALLAKHLRGVEVVPLDRALGRIAGELLRVAKTSDVIDAALVLLAEDDDLILTSDPDDLRPLAEAIGTHVELIPI